MIKDMVANGRALSLDREEQSTVKTGIMKFMANKRAGSVVLYAMAALLVAGFCPFCSTHWVKTLSLPSLSWVR